MIKNNVISEISTSVEVSPRAPFANKITAKTLNSNMDTCNRTVNQNLQEPDVQQDELFCISNLLCLTFEDNDYKIIDLHASETQTTVQKPKPQTRLIEISQEFAQLEPLLEGPESTEDSAVSRFSDLKQLPLKNSKHISGDSQATQFSIDSEFLTLDIRLQRTVDFEESVTQVTDTKSKNSSHESAPQEKLLDTISYIFLDEDKLEEIEHYSREPQVPLPPPSLQIKTPNHLSAVRLGSKIGLASVIFMSGFATGGVCSWAVLSNQYSTVKDKQLNSTRKDSNFKATQTSNTEAKNSISTPEVVLPEPSFTGDSFTEQTVQEPLLSKASFNKTESVTASTLSTQEHLLSLADLKGRSAWELTIMRNEIYARRGRIFKEPKLQRYFESQNWYQPRYTAEEFPNSILSKTELKNAIMIREYQRIHGLLINP